MQEFNPIHALINALGAAGHRANLVNQQGNTRLRLQQNGIYGATFPGDTHPGNPFTYPWGGNADRLSHVLTYGDYNNDAHRQAQFLNMLKQMGFLSHQAY